MILQPLAMVAIYALVLSEVLGAKLPGIDNKFAYAIYLVSGILCWSLFVDIVTRCLTVFVDNESLLKKMVFPRICLPLIVVGSALVNNVLLLLAAVLVAAAGGGGSRARRAARRGHAHGCGRGRAARRLIRQNPGFVATLGVSGALNLSDKGRGSPTQ